MFAFLSQLVFLAIFSALRLQKQEKRQDDTQTTDRARRIMKDWAAVLQTAGYDPNTGEVSDEDYLLNNLQVVGATSDKVGPDNSPAMNDGISSVNRSAGKVRAALNKTFGVEAVVWGAGKAWLDNATNLPIDPEEVDSIPEAQRKLRTVATLIPAALADKYEALMGEAESTDMGDTDETEEAISFLQSLQQTPSENGNGEEQDASQVAAEEQDSTEEQSS